ncbi:MAG: FtsX-like permease family protein [Acidobacteria bacterium]|nr:FtsX-like permease family protein [Acidobacteriota bacterium]
MDPFEKRSRVPLVYRIVFENLRHRRTRTVLSALAIGLGVAMMLSIVGLAEGMLDDQRDRARGVGADITILPPGMSVIGMSSAPMPEKTVEFVSSQPHVALATGVIVQPIKRIDRLTGIDFAQFDRMAHFVFVDGGPFENPFDVILDTFYANQKGVKVGDTIELLDREWTVRGIVEPGKMARVILQKDILQELTGATGKITTIYVKLDDPANVGDVIKDLEKKMEGYQVYSVEEIISEFSVTNIPELRTFINVIIGVAIGFGFLIIFLTMHTAVLERTREIGILKSLGASAGYILGIFVREAFALGVLGTAAGIGASYLVKYAIAAFIPTMQQAIVVSWWPISLGVTMVGALLGVLYPAMKAAKQDALESLSYD